MREGKCLSEETVDFQNKLKDSLQYSHNLQEKVEKISRQFETLREDKQNQFERFDFHILGLQKVIRDKDKELNTLKQNSPGVKESLAGAAPTQFENKIC